MSSRPQYAQGRDDRVALLSWIIAAAGLIPAAVHAGSCDSLETLGTPTVHISLAKSVGAGAFRLPEGTFRPPGAVVPFEKLPAFCRVAASLTPTADSDIRAEIWLPESGWNGKLLAVGSGGWGGAIGYDALADALARGYAAVGSDDGHESQGASFIVGHPQKLIDFAYRA